MTGNEELAAVPLLSVVVYLEPHRDRLTQIKEGERLRISVGDGDGDNMFWVNCPDTNTVTIDMLEGKFLGRMSEFAVEFWSLGSKLEESQPDPHEGIFTRAQWTHIWEYELIEMEIKDTTV